MSLIILRLFAASLMLTSALAQTSPPSQTELNGFLLGQYAKAADGAFGKPTQVQTADDRWTYRVYVFDREHTGYMVFKFPPDKQTCASIQIAGQIGTPMRPFLGLSLGDGRQKVEQVLGKPEKVQPEKDYDVDLYTYTDRNYSVELNRQGKVSSIQIMGYAGLPKRPTSSIPDVNSFRRAVVGKDVEALLSQLGGDLEIYSGDHTYDFGRSARADLSDQASETRKLVLGDGSSVRTAFTTESFEPDQQIRLYEKGPPGSVAKFPHSKIVDEIVYNFESGSWKIWEIKLR